MSPSRTAARTSTGGGRPAGHPEEAGLPARGRLDRVAVVRTALTLADTQGLDGLTVRHLAKELGVTPTALYWHFADKQALLDTLADQLWAEAQELLAAGTSDDTWDGLRAIFAALVDVFRRHPAVAPLAPARVLDCPAGLALTERALQLLGRAGYAGARGADAARFLLCAAIMMVTSQPGSWLADEEEREQAMRQKRAALLTLPPGRFPMVEAAAVHLVDCDAGADAYFEMGIDLIVGGLKAGSPGEAAAG